MAALHQTMSQVLARLRDISVSQRVALLLGGALVAVSLIWLVQWAASPELVPLLAQDLQPEELGLVRKGLESMGEKYQVRGSRVYVSPAANTQAIIAQLQLDEKMPANISTGFAALVEKSDPWISLEENDRRWTLALQREIEHVLKQFQGVQSASVFLNLTGRRPGFSKLPPASSASVTLVMKHGDEVPRELALAAARLVSGAVAGLPVRNVQVLDAGGGSALDWDSEQDAGNALHRLRLQHEQHYTETIRRQVPDPKALVSVQVELNSTTTSSQTETPTKGVAEKEETTSDRQTRVRRSEQPGVQPNVAVSAGSGGADETTGKESSKTEMRVGTAVKSEATPAGDIKLVTAAISLSSSYLESVFKRTNPGGEAPTDAQLEEVFQRERTRLAAQVARLVKPQAEENVAISRYYDTASQPVAAAEPVRALDQTLDLARRYAPQTGLGVLALISLAMMLRMSRRASPSEAFGMELGLPREAIEAAKRAAGDVAAASRSGGGRAAPSMVSPPAGAGGQDAEATVLMDVEQAAAMEGILVAQEVDPSTVQTRKMLDQVSEMVKTDPDTVAAVLEQWVQRHDTYHEQDA